MIYRTMELKICWKCFCIELGFLLAVCASNVVCTTLNDTQTLIEGLLQKYNTDVRPAMNQEDPVHVSVELVITSIHEVDEVKELFSFVGGLILTWNDPRMSWTPNNYGGASEITVSYNNVWVPEIVLTNPSEKIDSLGQKWQRVRYNSSGSAIWVPGNQFKTDCPIIAHQFPFDTQKCAAYYSPLGYTAREVTLKPVSNTVNLALFTGNAAWHIVRTEATSVMFARTSSEVEFVVYLKRKPDFFVINVLMPVCTLCILSSFAFLLVPESGERVSFCVTVFLSISVFLTIISEHLPRTSEPVPAISYALMLSSVLSSTSAVVAILNLRLYHREDQTNVPEWLQTLFTIRVCMPRKTNQVQEIDQQASGIHDESKSKPPNCMPLNDADLPENNSVYGIVHKCPTLDLREDDTTARVTWRKVSATIDKLSFVMFTVAGLGIFIAFMVATLA